MKSSNILSIPTIEEIEQAVEIALEKHQRKIAATQPEKYYTKNQAAKFLGIAHETVKKRIRQRMLREIKDGRIPHSSIEEYLKNEK